MNRHLSFLLLLQTSALCACEAERESARVESALDLDGADAAAFDDAFTAAVCACEARAYDPAAGDAVVNPARHVPASDEQMRAFADARFEGEISCPPVPPRAERRVPTTVNSGCVGYITGQPIEIPSGEAVPYAQGFCRGEINHCVANELLAAADSLAQAPRSRAVRDALLAESRVRFQYAATETAAATAYLLDNCDRPGVFLPGRVPEECDRLRLTTYPTHAVGVINDSALQIAQLVERGALNAAATGEGLSPG